MFRASSAHLQEDTVVYIQHMVLSLSMRVPGGRVTVPYAGFIELYCSLRALSIINSRQQNA